MTFKVNPRLPSVLCCLLAFSVFIGAGARPAQAAATITVNTTSDEALTDGNCSLREAIANANANTDTTGGDCVAGSAGADTADLSSVSGTITLGSALPTITDDLTISGPGASSVTINANGNAHVLSIGAVAVTIADVTLTGGSGAFFGGGIDSEFGTVTVVNTTIKGNTTGFGGAGIYNYGGSLSVRASTISGNSTSSFGSGGGIFSANGGTVTVDRSTISGNSAAFGGGIGLDGRSATIVNSTIANNTASGTGGGIDNELGTLTMVSSTITANSAPNFGFGSAGGIQMVFCTECASATLENTIVAAQAAGSNCTAVPGSIADAGYNLEDGTTCGFSTANQSLSNTNPMLDPAGLTDHGGPTQTIALLSGSPAIDVIPTGASGCGTTLTTDQRGVSRPQGAGCDIGAFEFVTPTLTVAIDIKPGSSTNPIKLSSAGVIPVAILSTDSFDATTVDPSTVCFGDDDNPSQRDCMAASGGHILDVNGDGRPDLVLQYKVSQTGIDPGDTTACLTGKTFAGVSIEGCDSITTL